MLATIITPILAFLLACTGPSGPVTDPPRVDDPDDDEREGQYFCCDSVGDGDNGKGAGEGCTLTGKEYVVTCSSILYCSGNWRMEDGTAKCLG